MLYNGYYRMVGILVSTISSVLSGLFISLSIWPMLLGNMVIYIKTEFFSILSEHLYFLNVLQVASIYSRRQILTNTEEF